MELQILAKVFRLVEEKQTRFTAEVYAITNLIILPPPLPILILQLL